MSNPGRRVWSSSRMRNIQARVDARYLAIIADDLNRKGEMVRSVSELCRYIIEEYAHERLRNGARIIDSGDEAEAILEFTMMPRNRIQQREFLDQRSPYQSIYDRGDKEEPVFKEEQEQPKKPYVMSKEEIRIFEMNAKFLDPNQNTPQSEPKTYGYEEGELDDLRGQAKEIRPRTVEETVELEEWLGEMEEYKERNKVKVKNRKETAELDKIYNELMLRWEDFRKRGLME